MRRIWFLAVCVAVCSALPSGVRDEIEADDDAYYSDMEPGMDLVAEESEGGLPMVMMAPEQDEEQPSPAEKERSLMLVMPLQAANASQLEELYYKKPVTRLVDTTTTQAPPSSTQQPGTTLVVTPTPQRKLPPAEVITLPPPVIRPDIKDLLASIGLSPESVEVSEPSAATPFPFRAAADSFSPEIKELMSQFGVLPLSNDYEPTTARPALPTPGSFANFKRIPDRLNVDDEMKDFLAQFGLVDRQTSSRQLTTPTPEQKIRPKVAVTTEAPGPIPTLHPDSMSDEMKRVLFELGLAPHLRQEDIQQAEETPAELVGGNETPGDPSKRFEERSSLNHEFVFNPTDAAPLDNAMEEKLKTILHTFKLLNRTSHTPEEMEQQLQEASRLFSKYRKGLSESGGPDPLATDELLLGLAEAHNDLQKRQNNDTTSTSTTTTTTTTETSSEDTSTKASSSSEEDKGPSLEDLESSFGGAGDEVPDETLPPPKPNGFYFLLDLNTFLNVGEDDKGVHLRLAPRLGNSKNFLPITVP